MILKGKYSFSFTVKLIKSKIEEESFQMTFNSLQMNKPIHAGH